MTTVKAIRDRESARRLRERRAAALKAAGKVDEQKRAREKARVTCICGRRKTRGVQYCESCRNGTQLTIEETMLAYNARNPDDQLTFEQVRNTLTSVMQKLRVLMYQDKEAGEWLVDAVDCLDERRGERLMAERNAHLLAKRGGVPVEGNDP